MSIIYGTSSKVSYWSFFECFFSLTKSIDAVFFKGATPEKGAVLDLESSSVLKTGGSTNTGGTQLQPNYTKLNPEDNLSMK
jgi:hypothetical protein